MASLKSAARLLAAMIHAPAQGGAGHVLGCTRLFGVSGARAWVPGRLGQGSGVRAQVSVSARSRHARTDDGGQDDREVRLSLPLILPYPYPYP